MRSESVSRGGRPSLDDLERSTSAGQRRAGGRGRVDGRTVPDGGDVHAVEGVLLVVELDELAAEFLEQFGRTEGVQAFQGEYVDVPLVRENPTHAVPQVGCRLLVTHLVLEILGVVVQRAVDGELQVLPLAQDLHEGRTDVLHLHLLVDQDLLAELDRNRHDGSLADTQDAGNIEVCPAEDGPHRHAEELSGTLLVLADDDELHLALLHGHEEREDADDPDDVVPTHRDERVEAQEGVVSCCLYDHGFHLLSE